MAFINDKHTLTVMIFLKCGLALQYKIIIHSMEALIKNKVAESGIVTIDLEEFYPKGDIAVFDIKEYLFMGLILKEKDFRLALQNLDIETYRDKYVAVTCTADAIIPMWAYMLIASTLQPVAKDIVFGNEQTLINALFLKNLSRLAW